MKKRNFKAPSGEVISFTELGFGTAPLGNLYRAVDPKTHRRRWRLHGRRASAISTPLRSMAWACRKTRLNRFLFGKKRKDYVLSTKVGRLLDVCPPKERTGIGKFFDTPSRRERFDYTYDGFMRSIEFSLERLGIDSIDVIFVHDCDVFTHGSEAARDVHVKTLMSSGYKALVKLRDEKVIKAFGAGVNEWQVAETLTRSGDFDIFLLAGRYTLLEQEALQSFLRCARSAAWESCSVGPTIPASSPRGRSPAPGTITTGTEAHPRARGEDRAVCRRHKVKLAQAALRFPLHHPQVVSVIPGGVNPRKWRSTPRQWA